MKDGDLLLMKRVASMRLEELRLAVEAREIRARFLIWILKGGKYDN